MAPNAPTPLVAVSASPTQRSQHSGETWAIVLAGGEGSRLRALTTTAAGVAIPKQFCSLRGGASLLHEALQRAEAIAPEARICAVVAEQHAQWWEQPLAGLAPANVFVQPQNRGTAIGMLFALAQVEERDPDANVVMLPADHHVAKEPVLSAALRRATGSLSHHPTGIVLLGIAPEEADPELGYIEPGRSDDGEIATVTRFVEKPSAAEAQALIARGALWNAFIIVARAHSLLQLFFPQHSALVARMRAAVRQPSSGETTSALHELYLDLPDVDFSRHVVPGQEAALRVLPVPSCGWTDLGTVRRVEKTLREPATRIAERRSVFRCAGHLSLEQQHRGLGPALL